MKKVFKNLSLIVLFKSSVTLALAGGIGDGGGQAVVCREANGAVKSAELLDLYEAKNYFLRTVDMSFEQEGYESISKNMLKFLIINFLQITQHQ